MYEMKLSQQVKEQILDALLPLEPKNIILFGSYAWGEPTKDSDIDIVFVGKEKGFFSSFEDRVLEKEKILRRLTNIDRPFDVLNYKDDEWDALLKTPNQFIKKIQAHGINLE